jgi:hypothetical protein
MRKTERIRIDTEDNAHTRRDGQTEGRLGREPLKCIVYDEWVRGPVRSIIHRVACLYEAGRMEDAIRTASALGREDLTIMPALITVLDPVMSQLVIRYSCPKLAWDISPLEPLIDRLEKHNGVRSFIVALQVCLLLYSPYCPSSPL